MPENRISSKAAREISDGIRALSGMEREVCQGKPPSKTFRRAIVPVLSCIKEHSKRLRSLDFASLLPILFANYHGYQTWLNQPITSQQKAQRRKPYP
jgi:hypothetical protein